MTIDTSHLQFEQATGWRALFADNTSRARDVIVKYPDPILRQNAIEVVDFDEVSGVVRELKRLVHATKGLGLAAPQVGIPLQMFAYYDSRLSGNRPQIIINPVITEYGSERTAMTEGCLSLPDQTRRVIRPATIKALGYDEAGNPVALEFEGLTAKVFQHEYDHLHGKLILDY